MADLGAGSGKEPASKRILLVEDNDINRQMLNDYLVF
jgi:CheY-like chemotaxis protein